MANAPDLSLRGAKRRGNLAVLCWISRKLRRKRNCFPEIAPQGHFLALRAQGATAPSGPRNDKSGSIAPLNSCHQYCQPAWRSLSAATDAIGRCVFIDTLHELEVPSRDCHVALLLAMTHQVVRRCTSALLPLNGSVQGGHYPQGARPSVRRQSRQRLRRERRYTPYFGVCRFHGRLYGSEVRSRERHAAPLQWCTPFNDSRYELEVPSRDCTPRALPRASRSGRHVASLLAMTNLWLSPFYR